MRRARADLGQRIDALSRAVELAPADDLVTAARAVLARSAARRSLAPERTVIALAGGTGSGKSTLFNRLVQADLAPTGVRRPMTSRSRAAVWPAPGEKDDAEDAARLLDWLEVRDRHWVESTAELAGLVLIDLPDYDSTVAEHRVEAERMAAVADLLVWVVDPQKYADAALHERYLRPLASHRDVMLVVLNQADRLAGSEVDACVRHLARLLTEDGLAGAPVLATSAVHGAGLDALCGELVRRVRTTRASVERLHADIDAAVADLLPLCGPVRESGRRTREADEDFLAALERASGVPAVAAAAGGQYRRDAHGSVGWPLTRWVARLKPDPLRRVRAAAARLSVDAAGAGIQRAQIANAVRDLVDAHTSGLPVEWSSALRSQTDQQGNQLPAALARAISEATPPGPRRPRWWAAGRAAHLLLLAVAAVGALWLATLAVLGYLRLSVPTPHLGRVPVPTVLLIGALVAGLLVALLLRPLVAWGARRRRAAVAASLSAAVGAAGREHVLVPLTEHLEDQRRFCAAVRTAVRDR